MRSRLPAAFLTLMPLIGFAPADPVGWRKDGTGNFPDAKPPSQWSADKNVVWKVALPGASYAAPVVVGDNLFVASDPGEILCVRRSDGKILWRKSLTDVKAPPVKRGFGFGNFLAEPLMKALDTDDDGKLSQVELAAGVRTFFKKADAASKGSLDEKAFAEGLTQILPRRRQGGRGGQPGGPAGPGRRGPGGFNPGAMLAGPLFKRADANKDAKVTLDELLTAAEAAFKEADKGKGGKIDESAVAAEINKVVPPPKFGRGPGGPGGPGGPSGPGGPGGGPGRPGGRGGYGGPGGMSAGNTAATPVSDGRHVAVVAGNGVVAVYTSEGKRLWARFVESPQIGFGHSASPLQLGSKLIVHIKDLVALDVATGKELWRVALRPTHASPVAARLGKEEVVVSPSGAIVSAADGKVLARGKFRASQSSPVVQGDTVYVFGETMEAHKLDRNNAGKVTVTRLWSEDGPAEMHHLPSPLVHGGLIYGVTTAGQLYVLDAVTGQTVYRQRLGLGQVYGSVALAGGRLYVMDTRGKAVVFKPGRKFQRVATNELEGTGASPVFAGDYLYLRGFKNLYCLGGTAKQGD